MSVPTGSEEANKLLLGAAADKRSCITTACCCAGAYYHQSIVVSVCDLAAALYLSALYTMRVLIDPLPHFAEMANSHLSMTCCAMYIYERVWGSIGPAAAKPQLYSLFSIILRMCVFRLCIYL